MTEGSIKDKIVQVFKELMMQIPFSQLTISTLTEKAEIARPTFYYYFKDKHEIFDYILNEDLFNAVHEQLSLGKVSEAVQMIFVYFAKHQAFYHRAFQVQGQNSFEEILEENLKSSLDTLVSYEQIEVKEVISDLSQSILMDYHTKGLIFYIKNWLDPKHFASQSRKAIYQDYVFLVTHSLSDIYGTKNVQSE